MERPQGAGTTDLELLEAWRDGDERAGRKLFHRQFPALYRFFRTKVASGVDDLVQETLVRCLESVAGLRTRSSFRAFLFTIARRVLYGHYRFRHKDAVLDFGVTSVRDLGPSPSSMWAQRRLQQRVIEALSQIPLQYQIVLELYYWEGLTCDELAEVLEIPPPTARTQLRRGRERVGALLATSTEGDALETRMAELREPACYVGSA
jgi:RNA polymerase sigma-70 factor, ECF subfamily